LFEELPFLNVMFLCGK